MNLCINTGFTDRLSFEDRLRLIKEAGFDSVMMNFKTPAEFRGEVDIIRKSGLRIENMHCPFGNGMMNRLWSDEDPAQTLMLIHSAIDCCSLYGIKTLVVHPSDGLEPPSVSQCGLKYFQGIVSYAEKKNVRTAFENIQRPEYLKTLFERLEGGNIGFCFDTGHENCFSKGKDMLSEYGERLCALHIHDNNGEADSHLIPFDGNIDFSETVKRLCALDYRGAVSLEVMTDKSRLYDALTPELYIKRAYSAAKRLSSYFKAEKENER